MSSSQDERVVLSLLDNLIYRARGEIHVNTYWRGRVFRLFYWHWLGEGYTYSWTVLVLDFWVTEKGHPSA